MRDCGIEAFHAVNHDCSITGKQGCNYPFAVLPARNAISAVLLCSRLSANELRLFFSGRYLSSGNRHVLRDQQADRAGDRTRLVH